MCLCVYLSICLSVYLSIYMQAWKRSYSARLPQSLSLTTSKTQQYQQFCETSSIFEVGNIKNERILRDILQEWKVECRADGLVPLHLAIFPLHLSKVLRLPRKSDAKSYKVLHLSRKIIFANLKIWCSKMQPFSGNQRSDLLTSPVNMSLVLRLPREIDLCRSSSNVPRLPLFLEMLQATHVSLTFGRVENPCACHAKRCFNVQKWREHVVLCTVWLPNFAPQRRALFQHLNFQKCSEADVLCAFWLRNVLRATTACTFWTSQLPKVLWTWCALYILTAKCASRPNGVQLFISHPAKWLRTRRFSEPTFRPFGATNHWKTQCFAVFRDFPTFSRTCMFFLLTLSLL